MYIPKNQSIHKVGLVTNDTQTWNGRSLKLADFRKSTQINEVATGRILVFRKLGCKKRSIYYVYVSDDGSEGAGAGAGASANDDDDDGDHSDDETHKDKAQPEYN